MFNDFVILGPFITINMEDDECETAHALTQNRFIPKYVEDLECIWKDYNLTRTYILRVYLLTKTAP